LTTPCNKNNWKFKIGNLKKRKKESDKIKDEEVFRRLLKFKNYNLKLTI